MLSQINAFSYEYDLNGNRIAANLRGVATYYSYNNADALTEKWTEPGPAGASYCSCDLDGHRRRQAEGRRRAKPGAPSPRRGREAMRSATWSSSRTSRAAF